jgi:Family of unknown function (DUF6493)
MLDPQLVEAAIRRGDAAAVRDLLSHATESDRAACAKALKEFLRGPKWEPPELVMLAPEQFAAFLGSGFQRPPQAVRRQQEDYERRNREYSAWRDIANGLAFQLASLGLAGGVAIAARTASEMSSWGSVGTADVDLVAGVLADRRPDWLADFVRRHLRTEFGFPAWPLARQLVRLGAIPRPDVPEYTTLMPYGARWQAQGPGGNDAPWPDPAPALLADPGLLEDEIWRLFTVPEAAAELDRADSRSGWWDGAKRARPQTWSEGLAQLCAAGHLDRGRVIDACLAAFARDFNPNRVGWYAAALREIRPSDAEIAARAETYLGLLAATSKTGVTVGQDALSGLLDAGLLDPGRLLDASGPALLFPQKNIATRQLKLIGRAGAKDPAARPRATAAAAVAFGHERQDVQEAALALIRRLGGPAGPALAQIQLRAMDLSPSLAAEAAALGLLPPAAGPGESRRAGDELAGDLAGWHDRISVLPAEQARGLTAALELVRDGGVPGPARVRPAAGAVVPPVTDPDELIQLLTVLIEDACDALAAERALAGAVRLSALPVSQRRRLAAPLLKRAERVINRNSPFTGTLITSDLALIATAWAGEPLPTEANDREDSWHMPGEFAVSSSGQALTMAGIFSARAWEAARIIEAGQGGTLLAEPETERGAISAETLLERIRGLAAGRDRAGRALRHDREQALLRLAPADAGDALWAAWASLAGQSAAALRESHQIVQAPLAFAAVAGRPQGQPLRASHTWYQHLLARITGPVAPAPACRSWQLLTALANPLTDHAVLYGPSRYYTRHYDAAVAGWRLICPWQPELAAAHLLRPLNDGLIPGITPATMAIASLSHPDHPLGPVGHLALVTGLASAEADTRIASAQLWTEACADGRLDPALAAAAVVTGVRGDALKLSRIADGLQHASHHELAAWRIIETIAASASGLAPAPANMHLLIELAARIGTRTGLPALPDAVREMAARRGRSRLTTTARQLLRAGDGEAPDRGRAAAAALAAQVMRAEMAGR